MVEGLSIAQIAAETFSSKRTVKNWIKLYKIPLKIGDLVNFATIPFGATKIEQDTRTKIIELREQGLSIRQIVEVLNLLETPTRAPGAKWHNKTVLKVLQRSLSS